MGRIPLSQHLEIKEKQISTMSKEQLMKELKKAEAKLLKLKKEIHQLDEDYEEFQQKIKMAKSELEKYKRLPYVVCTISEILKAKDVVGAKSITNTAKVDAGDKQNDDELIVVKVPPRLTYMLPNSGLIKPGVLKVGDLAALSRDRLQLIELLPSEYDPRVKVL
ncbi:26S protease regulatory subunit 6A -like protein [Trichinella pseudospiralis]|uniref:26S protease regulatory subunit 6A-like protein n=1 Tax=Trichinella pseudospiralis TaxID=6337 RepID=A0A0V1DUH4_TRIPS|nr:26S protease regulatory subunit 6A -like protein [Trichinella pseudospiralis]